MKLTSEDGTAVLLRPSGYQFGASSTPRDWDSNWLIVAADVELPDGRSWSFADPCLTTWEARILTSWLRDVQSGRIQPAPFDGSEDERLVVFTEPNLAFSLAERGDGGVTIRVHMSLESRPPWLQDDESSDLFEYFVEVSPTHEALAQAIDQWERELVAFPVR